MILGNIEWIGSICALLSILCAIQLIVVGILLWHIPEVLTLTKTHIASLAGLIACFVTLPAVIRFKTARMSPNLDRTYGYTLSYQRLTLSVAGVLHLIALVLAIVTLATVGNLGKDFIKLMEVYDSKPQAKTLVDNIQYVLQCCGGYSYKDWYENTSRRTSHLDKKESCLTLLNEIATVRFDEVPFSCCSKRVPFRCTYKNLEEFGVGTISANGCGIELGRFAHKLLWFEFGFYSICFCLEAASLILLVERKTTDASDEEVEYDKPEEWGSFYNQDSSNAIIWPSSHTEKKVEILK